MEEITDFHKDYLLKKTCDNLYMTAVLACLNSLRVWIRVTCIICQPFSSIVMLSHMNCKVHELSETSDFFATDAHPWTSQY